MTSEHAGTATAEQLRAASDPATPAATLAELATAYPQLRLTIARNAAAYDELLQWLHQYGDAEVKAAVAARRQESAIPPAPLPAAAAAPTMPQSGVPGNQLNTFALLAVIFAFGGGTLGIVFGHFARRQIRVTGEDGAYLALIGLVVGYIVTGLLLLLFLGAVTIDGWSNSY